MSMVADMWMTPAKRRLIRRTLGNGPYGYPDPPPGTEEFTNVVVDATDPGHQKLKATGPAGSAFVLHDLVVLVPKEGTGTPEARAMFQGLRAVVDNEGMPPPDVVFSTAPTDLTAVTGIDYTGLVLLVMPVE